VWFDHTDGGLVAKGGDLKSFEIAGADGKFVAAQARIDNNTVVVTSSAVANPVSVRYGWDGSPECNLYNGEGLPASPFRTNRWTDPLVYR
jgi:sialate O-acetylesterase